MPVCDNVNNPREEYLRTKTGYIHQCQTQVEGNVMKKNKRDRKLSDEKETLDLLWYTLKFLMMVNTLHLLCS